MASSQSVPTPRTCRQRTESSLSTSRLIKPSYITEHFNLVGASPGLTNFSMDTKFEVLSNQRAMMLGSLDVAQKAGES
jgi:hypothetical protein